MMHYKMTISYVGTRYAGWQKQPNALSIQQLIEEALFKLLKHDIHLMGSGRTDAGVHAIAQIASFKSQDKLDVELIKRALNGLLPKDIRIIELIEVSEEFHPRFSAIKKEYHYYLHTGDVQSPFWVDYSLFVRDTLDEELLKEACQLLVGQHDFTSFANRRGNETEKTNFVRNVMSIECKPWEHGIRLEFVANSFLYKMVRNLTGAILCCAQEKLSLQELKEIMEKKDRRLAPAAAPAKALFLIEVTY